MCLQSSLCPWVCAVGTKRSPGTTFPHRDTRQAPETFPPCPAAAGGSCPVPCRASERLKPPLIPIVTPQLRVRSGCSHSSALPAPSPGPARSDTAAAGHLYLLPSCRRSQAPPLPPARAVGPTPGPLCIRFWHSEISACLTEVVPTAPGTRQGACRARRR